MHHHGGAVGLRVQILLTLVVQLQNLLLFMSAVFVIMLPDCASCGCELIYQYTGVSICIYIYW